MRLIDADNLCFEMPENPHYMTEVLVNALKNIVNNTPTIEAEPVRHGEWGTYGIAEVCDQCNLHIVVEQYSEGDMNYCPNCGAKMDGGIEND